ncbi:MAG: argininosuccinate lyase, partial [Pyrinomonadaceae bacterium]
MSEAKKLWGGRFKGQIDPGFARFNRSFGFDRRLFEADVRGSLAHCEGLRAAGVLNEEEAGAVKRGLLELLARAEREGEAFFNDETAEDVHSF